MAEVVLPWGKEELKFTLPAHWSLQQLATPDLHAAEQDWPDRMAALLNQPIGGTGLANLLSEKRGGRIVIIVEDSTRHSPLTKILPVVLKEIRHGGVADEQIELFIATGMHVPMTDEEVAAKLGPEAAELKWRCNPWQDKSQYIPVGKVGKWDVEVDHGVATADLRIIISSVSPHLQAGFGGGYKMLFPGCASLETIRNLHQLGLGRTASQLVGTDDSQNPMRKTIECCGQLIDKFAGASFGVQYLLDEKDEPAMIATGELAATQKMLSKKCSVACGVLMESPADILITNAHPRDLDIWQCFKGISNTLWAAKRNGIVICTALCEQGVHGFKSIPWPLNPRWTRKMVQMLGPEAISSLLMRLVPRLGGDAAFFVRMGLQTIHRNPLFMVSPTLKAEMGKFPGIELFATIEEAIEAADELLGNSPQRVTVFSSGGITFPIPSSANKNSQG